LGKTYTIKKKTEDVLGTSKEAGGDVNTQKTKYMVTLCLDTKIQDKSQFTDYY